MGKLFRVCASEPELGGLHCSVFRFFRTAIILRNASPKRETLRYASGQVAGGLADAFQSGASPPLEHCTLSFGACVQSARRKRYRGASCMCASGVALCLGETYETRWSELPLGGRMAEGAKMKLGSRGNFVLHCCCLPPKQYRQMEARMSLAEVRICPLEV